jgi:hypothetical protein
VVITPRGGLGVCRNAVQTDSKIASHERGAQLVGVTLPRSKSMGFSASFGSQDFFEVSTQIEATL